jgi:nucleoid DNA-binding protein
MDELIKLVSKKANISADQAKQAVDSVLAFLKDKLPAPVLDQIKAALSGKQVDAGGVSSALGGLFGGKKK